uniref:Uncharacterized protein n=1 Tax=Leersia perrieri TaxID=77586 RepID=A0A0D9XHM5_9ORYZ
MTLTHPNIPAPRSRCCRLRCRYPLSAAAPVVFLVLGGGDCGSAIPDLAGVGSTSPNLAGAGSASPDLAGTGSASLDLAGVGFTSPDLAGGGSASTEGLQPPLAGGADIFVIVIHSVSPLPLSSSSSPPLPPSLWFARH